MAVRGWKARYLEILREFGYSRAKDAESARTLGRILGRSCAGEAKAMICGRPVIVIGAGPSLSAAVSALKKTRAIKIAAGSSAGFLLQSGIVPDVIVTDLDGDIKPLKRLAKKSLFVVHAHGDNAHLLPLAGGFARCIGTAQSGPAGRVKDYGGFTDGDRAVFFAHHFGASKIALLGMDFGARIGRHSHTLKSERETKLKKLARGRQLLEWLATFSCAKLYSTSEIAGFERVSCSELASVPGY